MDSEMFLLMSLVIFFWPILISSLYLIFRWQVIHRKVSFLFVTTLVGYFLFIGLPFLLRMSIKSYFGTEKVLSQALEDPSHRWFISYYWDILAFIGLVIVLLPIFSTHYIYRKRLLNG